MIYGTNIDSSVSRNSEFSSAGQKRTDDYVVKCAAVLITGDLTGLPPELDGLIRDCGCKAFVTTDLAAYKDLKQVPFDAIIVNFATVQAANPERVEELRKTYRKPVLCLLPVPTEQEIARVASIRADVLIFKPLRAEEIKCRIRLLLREQKFENTHPIVVRGERGSLLQISARDKVIVLDGQRLQLMRKEYELLCLLAFEPGRVVSVAEILASVWPGSRRAMASDVHQCVCALRKKIEKDRRNPQLIITVAGSGYRLGSTVRHDRSASENGRRAGG